MFTKKDLYSSLTTGLITGFIAWRVFAFLGRTEAFGVSFFWLVFLVPILWILGVNLGYFLGRWMPFFNQFGKYASIGFTNSAVDFGILNLLIAYSGIASGFTFSGFKGISFVVAVTHSYVWNKYWAFEEHSRAEGGEFLKFFVVNVVVALINIGSASLVVNGVTPRFGLEPNAWANVGAVVGSAVALIFNFTAFKLIVFKKNDNSVPQI